MAESKPVYIGKLVFEDYHSFKGLHELDLMDKEGHLYQWTVFLGNNNTGKTNLLKSISKLIPFVRKSSNLYLYDASIGIDNNTVYFGCHFYFEPRKTSKNIYRKNLKLLIDTGEIDTDSALSITEETWEKFIADHRNEIYGYGVTRRASNNGISEKNEELNSASLFNPEHKLTNIEEWLFQLDYASKNGQAAADVRLKLLKEIIKSEILPEILDFRFTTTESLKNFIEYQTKEGWFLFEQLGYGYQATMAWIIDLCKKMFERYPDSSNPLKEPAIVLVDELDLHLHPKWQKTIVDYLTKTFTATQFIVTTHSPLILQTIEKVNLFALIKVEDRVNIRHIPTQSLEGWSVEEILREVMEMDEGVYSDKYNELYKEFDAALDSENLELANAAYNKLLEILHPTSPERTLLKLQLSQIVPVNDKA